MELKQDEAEKEVDIEFELLIVPYGIETSKETSRTGWFESFNRTLWN